MRPRIDLFVTQHCGRGDGDCLRHDATGCKMPTKIGSIVLALAVTLLAATTPMDPW
jgi:hypothetical protein